MQEEGQIRKMLEMMNRHIPSKRSSLADLLKQREAGYKGKDGIDYRIKKAELDLLAGMLDDMEMNKLKLPIIIMTDTSSDSGGSWKVMGRVEVKVVSALVGREPEFPDQMRLFNPHVGKLRSVLPTATTTLFSP